MAGLEDILKAVPIDQIAAKLGVDRDTATRAVQEGSGAILSGLQQNAASTQGSAAIQAALGAHVGGADAVDVEKVDTADGSKILGHVFGGRQAEVAKALTDEPQTAGIDFGALLPMLAPIVMGLIAKQQPPATSPASSSGGLSDVLGGLLGGGRGTTGGTAGGFDLGSVLGGLLGGPR